MKAILSRVRDGTPLPPWAERLIVVSLCCFLFGELFFSGCRLSQTADEPTHLYSGYRYLKCGDLTVSPEHPPLAKVVAAAPLLLMDSGVNCAPFDGDNVAQAIASLQWLYSQDWLSALLRARMVMSVFALGTCVLVWMTARRMFGVATAVVATVLVVFEPNLLAYGAVVMTDVPVACMLLFTAFAFYLWVQKRTVPLLLLTALATGLTLLAKHSGVVAVPILCVLAVADPLVSRERPRLMLQAVVRNLLAVVLVCAIAIGVVWVGYGMRFAAYPGAEQFGGAKPELHSKAAWLLLSLKNHRLLPEAYLEGFAGAVTISTRPGPAFVAGKIYDAAPWFSVPFQLLIRNTSGLLALFLIAACGAVVIFGQRRREVLFLVIPAAVFLAVCLRSSMTGGVRYLLPAFPFLLITTAAGCVELGRRMRWVRYAVPSLIVLHAVSSLHAYPNYLSYANEFWGGPTNAYRYLTGLDSGQAYPEARTYLQQHATANCWFVTGWQWDPKAYGIPCETYGIYLPNQVPARLHGTVIVSSSLLTDVRLAEGELAAPFKSAAPEDTIGGSALLVYRGDFDTRLAAAMSERLQAVLSFSAGQSSAALMHDRRSVELAPMSAYAHHSYCALLAEVGQIDSALNECSTARNLLLRDPLRDEPQRQKFLASIDAQVVLLTDRRAAPQHEAQVLPSASHNDLR